MKPRTCIHPSGFFLYGVHRPRYQVTNLREHDFSGSLGTFEDGTPHGNQVNFPAGPVEEPGADWVFEIPNPFPFRGTTYLNKQWADAAAGNPTAIGLPEPPRTSLTEALEIWSGEARLTPERLDQAFRTLPEPLQLSLAATSTDPEDLVRLAHLCCRFSYEAEKGEPTGLKYERGEQGARALISHPQLFETLVNNPYLPDHYKRIMVLRPGVQGGSEIVGDWSDDHDCFIFEYLRRNSYIPWGHYAANLADRTIRYRVEDLGLADFKGLRHLYYQRTFTRLAEMLKLPLPGRQRPLTPRELEELRSKIQDRLETAAPELEYTATLWGWNYGFDYAPSGYRLHASHQQIHQQYALLPPEVAACRNGEEAGSQTIPAYGCGDLVADFIADYRQATGRDFFTAYLEAIRGNRRFDRREGKTSLVVYEDSQVMLFVPKAQTSQWELQLLVCKPVGNVLEANAATRNSLDRAMLLAMRILTGLGARLITTIEYPKRFDAGDNGQHLLYSFLPRLPESPGAFSEAQLRFINGHYPEDFATACRARLPEIETKLIESS